jgi:hypothetical protein
MKYFTPELVSHMRSGDPDTHDEWEEAGARYSQYLAQVRESFPPGVRRLFSRFYLHDAAIHRIAQKERVFLIELQLDTPPRSFLTLRYRLLRPVEIDRASLPVACRSKGPGVAWLYGEIEQFTPEDVLSSPCTSTWVQDTWLDQARASGREPGARWPFWEHRILLSNGWELKLCFHDVEIEEYEDVLMPVVGNGRMAASDSTSTSV